jgi:ABC-type sugar transport system permease subunit
VCVGRSNLCVVARKRATYISAGIHPMKSRGVHAPVQRAAPYVFLAPYALLSLVFLAYPLFDALRLAFYQTHGALAREWVGFDNFTFLLRDRNFHQAVGNTAVFAFVTTALMLPLSLGLALLLNSRRLRFRSFFRLVFFSPSFVGQVFVGLLFSVIFVPRYGLMNHFLHTLLGWGLETEWLTDPSMAMPALILTNLWMYVGFNMVYFLAALQNVDESLVEAARIDGAGPWAVFWHVILPSIKPVTVFVFVICMINSFQLFELPWTMFKQTFGPSNSGITMVGYLYDAAFNTGDLGLAAAVGWVLGCAIMLVSLLQIRVLGANREEP